MKKQISLMLLLAASAATIFTGCKKDDDDDKKQPTCNIVRLTTTDGISTIAYNSEGKPSQLTNVSGVNTTEATYVYSGNTLIILRKYNNTPNSRDSVTFGSNGMIANFRTYQLPANTWTNKAYTYNGSKELTGSQETNSANSTIATASFTYSNGNLITIIEGSTVTNLGYDLTKTAQKGDYLDFFQMLNYGGKYIESKNQIINFQSGSTSNLLSYDYDSDGKIIKMTLVNGSTVEAVNYDYDCK